MRPRKWNAPGRGSGARAGELRIANYRRNSTAPCLRAQPAPVIVIEAVGDAERELQVAVQELLSRGATCDARHYLLNAEAVLSAARVHLDRVLLAGGPSC